MIFPQQTIQCKGKLLDLTSPLVMGILNVTPDSFYKESRLQNIDKVIEVAGKMMEDGAAILDVGGMSSRPGAELIDVQEELARVLPVIEAITKEYPSSVISIDTVHSEVARRAVEAGASMINDISAGKIDLKMYETVAKLNVPYILMHMQGKPSTMQEQTNYNEVTNDVLNFLIFEIQQLKTLGLKDIIIDPGFGFGKNIDQNYTLLRQLHVLKILDCPILVGLSRKSMIYKTLYIEPSEALNGTSVLHLKALQEGAKLLRVHDVKEAVEVVNLWRKTHSNSSLA